MIKLGEMGNIFERIKKFITPPKWDSWQTLVWMSIFSWAVSLLVSNVFQLLIASIGWVFLIPGVHWFMHEEKLKLAGGTEINVKKNLEFNKFFVAPWITGALICTFLFGGVLFELIPSLAFICWPIISVVIAVLPKFIKVGPEYQKPAPPARQEIIILLLWNLLLSCWFQLYFSTQAWLREYPSLLSEDLNKSAFVYKMVTEEKPVPRGVVLLERAEQSLKDALANQSWAQVEKWLFKLGPQLEGVRSTVMSQFPDIKENPFWRLEGNVLPGTEYKLDLYAIWQGPTAEANGYYLKKTCQITRVADVRSATVPSRVGAGLASATQRVSIECGTVSPRIPGQPPKRIYPSAGA